MENITISVSGYDRNTNTMTVDFEGARGCLEMSGLNAELKELNVENGRIFVPADPFFWLSFMEAETISVEVSIKQ